MKKSVLCTCAVALLWARAAGAQTTETVIVTGDFQAPVSVDKSGVPAANVPRSVQIVPRALIEQQGAVKLSDTLRDVSGVTQGGQFAFGFYDRFIVRGLNASFLNDGLPDQTSDLGGYVHSLAGVERVEVLKGPGSAMYGGAEPGGVINLVHYRPTAERSMRLSEQVGSYNRSVTDFSWNGATGIDGLNARVDGEFERSDGFRNQGRKDADLLASLGYQAGGHALLLRYEYHDYRDVPDAVGTPFSTTTTPINTGRPLAVPRDTTYYTPFAFANQRMNEGFFSDAWTVDASLTVNTRFAYTARNVDLARNAGGSLGANAGLFRLTGRQLRRQSDNSGDFNFNLEPTWRFSTAGIGHTLVTGVQVRSINGGTVRSTADLPNITDVFHPVTTETGLAALTFACDSGHSCDNAKLSFEDEAVYLLDQMDLSSAWKLRLSARADSFNSSATGRALVPANGASQRPCSPPQATQCPLVPGVPFSRTDDVYSWDVGSVYFLQDNLSAFAGWSSTAYPVFNTEEPESVGQVPETGGQVEGGLRWHNDFASLSTSVYQATRKNVFTTLTVPNPAGPGNLSEPTVFSYRSKGWETDLNLHPLEGWTIIANYTIANAVITSLPTAPANVGKAAPSTPATLANLWTSYTLPLDGLPLQLSAGVRYRSHMYGDMGQTRLIPGVPLFDAAVALPLQDFNFRIGVDNLANRRNWAYGAGTGSGAMPGQGRTFFFKIDASL